MSPAPAKHDSRSSQGRYPAQTESQGTLDASVIFESQDVDWARSLRRFSLYHSAF
jgi:hypothetical protein